MPQAIGAISRPRDIWQAKRTVSRTGEIALEELLMVWLANGNPAFAPYGELFDDRNLEDGSAYLARRRAASRATSGHSRLLGRTTRT